MSSFRSRARRILRDGRKLRRCSAGEVWSLVEALCTAGAIAGLLHTCSFRQVLRLVERWAQSHPSAHLAPDEEQRILWAVEAVTRRLLPTRPCLTQALAAYVLLTRRGAQRPTLQIGVKRGENDDLDAHAWLEREGTVVIGGDTSPSTYSILSPRRAKQDTE